jgi:hypothetical protein
MATKIKRSKVSKSLPIKGVVLSITSFRGVSPGAIHYYGRLHHYETEPRVDLEVRRALSAREARELTKLDRSTYSWYKGGGYKPGDLTDRFDSILELRAFALKHYKELVPGTMLLLVGQFAVADPQECLDGPEDLKLSINNHWSLFERCGGHDGNRKEADFLYRSYQKLLKKHKVKL